LDLLCEQSIAARSTCEDLSDTTLDPSVRNDRGNGARKDPQPVGCYSRSFSTACQTSIRAFRNACRRGRPSSNHPSPPTALTRVTQSGTRSALAAPRATLPTAPTTTPPTLITHRAVASPDSTCRQAATTAGRFRGGGTKPGFDKCLSCE